MEEFYFGSSLNLTSRQSDFCIDLYKVTLRKVWLKLFEIRLNLVTKKK